jgi:hypothetical protein
MDREPPVMRGDRAFTFRVTFVCLFLGVALALAVGGLLYSLRQPLATDPQGAVVWSPGAFMVPLAGLVSVVILAWSVFYLPVMIARRRGVVLDPDVWPMTGAVAIGVLVIIGFVGAILLGVL